MSDTRKKKALVLTEDASLLTITLPDYDRELSYVLGQNQGKPVIKPQFDYQAEEERYSNGLYLLAKLRNKLQKQKYLDQLHPSLTEQRTIASELRQHIENFRPEGEGGQRKNKWVFQHKKRPILHWSDEVVPLVHEALRTFGYNAIRLSPTDAVLVSRYKSMEMSLPPVGTSSPLDAELVSGHDTRVPSYNSLLIELDRLSIVIGEIIRDWQQRVIEEQEIEKRSCVQKYLQDIGQSLVPSMKGKREKRVMEPEEVKLHYYRQRFACEQANELLRKLVNVLGYHRWQTRLRAVCDLLNLPYDRRWWAFSEQGKVLRQLLIPTESAVVLTARHFAPAKEQTIRNILSL